MPEINKQPEPQALKGPTVREFEIRTVDQRFGEAPVIFVDGVQGFAITTNGLVRLNLIQDQLRSPVQPNEGGDPVDRVVVARLLMTADQLYRIQQWLNQLVAQLIEDGSLKPDDSPTGHSVRHI